MKNVQNEKQPNIVFVMADQYRRQAMGFWSKAKYADKVRDVGDPVHTPHMDAFADESIVFSQAVSTYPLCSPYRGMMMSGRFPANNGVTQNCKAGRTSSLREDIVCFTDVLADRGYNVGYIGKLHLDMPQTHFDSTGEYVGEKGSYYSDGSQLGEISCWDMVTPAGPKRHGIDYWYSYGTFDVHKNPHYWDNNAIKHEPKEWSPKHEADKAISYIKNKEGDRDGEKPFCLFVSMNPPHNPYGSIEDTHEEMLEKFYSEEVIPDAARLLNRPNAVIDEELKNKVRHYFSHVSGVDRQFGRILEAIEEVDQVENTIVVFTSDHGELMGSHHLYGKGPAYEESLSIPFLLRYPHKLEHRVEDLMLGGPDVMPTLLSLAGYKEYLPEDLDGTDYAEILVKGDEASIQPPLSAFYMCGDDRRGVKTKDYLYTLRLNGEKEVELYQIFDLNQDIYQLHPLGRENLDPETDTFLREELGYWLQASKDSWYQQGIKSELIIYPQGA